MAEAAMAVSSRVDQPQVGYAGEMALSSLSAAAAHISANCLVDGPVELVGLELEAHCFDVTDPLRRPEWQEIRDVIARVPNLPGRSLVTVEPGGAVELSGPPCRGVVSAVEALQADRAVLRTVFAKAGFGLVLLGADPLRPPRRVNPGDRYQAMERHFAAAGTGEAGAAMMTSTASIQVNIDAGPAAGWADRVRLAHALGPTMIAISANSPLLAGSFSGWRSSRQRVWSQLDTARCGPILGADGDDPGSDWARYALRAPVMLFHADDGAAVPVTGYVAFGDWVDGQAELAGRRPTIADLDYHLTTLFPPVRPRRWLEIRYLDSVPDALWPAVVHTLVTLLDDDADFAAEVTEPVATAWDVAARVGLADQRLHTSAVQCVRRAAERVPAPLEDSMQRLLRIVEKAGCPGDEFAEQVIRRGVAEAVTHLARGEG
jgi:glutamate--cysteine ligase